MGDKEQIIENIVKISNLSKSCVTAILDEVGVYSVGAEGKISDACTAIEFEHVAQHGDVISCSLQELEDSLKPLFQNS